MQTSESFRLSAILSLSGGLQDAYTYNVRGQVFANAQTGNVVLMSQNFMEGNVDAGFQYMMPLLAFAFGIFIAERVEGSLKENPVMHWRQLIIMIEIGALVLVGMLPPEVKLIANMIVSFSCAMQVQTFRKVHGYGYASTMCIGNLRSGTESLSAYMREKKREHLIKALHFFSILLIFAVGAGVGGVLSHRLGTGTIWISAGLLIIALVMMERETR